jgi:hypothetical protein
MERNSDGDYPVNCSDYGSYYSWGIPSVYGDEYDDEAENKKERPWNILKREEGEKYSDFEERK